MVKEVTERREGFLFGGKALTVMGDQLNVGDSAPDFRLSANNYSHVTLADSAGKVRLISVVPSLDTSVCDTQTRRFNQEVDQFGEDVVFYTVSAEHPINQKRWCHYAQVDKLQVLSDHMDMSFGDAYGTHIKERRLEQRSIFVVDKNDRIAYVQYVGAAGELPDFDKALEAVRQAINN